MQAFLPEFYCSELISRIVSTYWPLFVIIAFYAPFVVSSVFVGRLSPTRDAWLRSISSSLITVWALITVALIIINLDAPHGKLEPQWFLLIGVDATLALAVVFAVTTLRAALSRRLGVPPGITLGNAAAIVAVYADLVFVVLVATPIR